MRPDNIIPFPQRRVRRPDPASLAEAVAETLAQASTEVSRLTYAYQRAEGDTQRLYTLTREAVEAAYIDARATLARMHDAMNYTAGGTA